MSGLGAIFHCNGAPVSSDGPRRMMNALKLYGIDKQNSRSVDNFGLCWTHKSGFVPEDSYETQPVIADNLSLLFSGYLTERQELATALNIDPARLKTIPDSQMVMIAWQKWRHDTPRHIHGRVTVIVADHDNQRLCAFRSPIQADPLFYHEETDRFVIATAPKAIFALGDIPREMNETRIADSLILNYEDVESSYYKNVKRVPLGQMLIVSRDGKKIESFYDLLSSNEIRFSNEGSYVEAAQEKLAQSVKCAMRTAQVPGALLSSGYDSSAVVVGMLEELGWTGDAGRHRLDTYTHVPESGWDGRTIGHQRVGDESGPVKAMAEKYPAIATNFIDSQGITPDQDLDLLFLMAEIPPRNAVNIYWILDIYKQAARDGHNIVLDGQYGNASLSFDGRSIYAHLFRQRKWMRLFQELRKSREPSHRFWGLYSRAIAPNVPHGLAKKISRFRGLERKTGWRSFSAVNPEFVSEMQGEERAADMGWDDSFRGFANNREKMQHMLTRGARDEGQSIAYAMEAITGVQSRNPLGDRRLVEFCAGLPDEQFIKGGSNRRLLKRMMAGKLPDAILSSPRGRQAADRHVRFTRELPRYRAEVDALAQNPAMAKRFNLPRLQRLMDNWPDETPLSDEDHPDYLMANTGLIRALTTARYINWVEGNNR